MYTKEIIIKLIKKARKLKREKGFSARTIAEKMKVSKDSVNKRLKMEFQSNETVKEEYKEKRGFKKGVFRKYTKIVGDRIEEIYAKMIEEKRFFINPHTILDNYKAVYGKDKKNIIPTIYYIEFIQKQKKLHRKHKKVFIKGLSKYMNYPAETINKLGYTTEGIDFIGPRYLQGDSVPYHFLSRRYVRPEKYGQIDVIKGQTTRQTMEKLIEDRDRKWPIPDVLKIDNDSAFGMLKSSKTKDCIGGFTKWLLHLGVIPLYSVPREPWNNGNVEGQNSIFNQLFWQAILFDSPAHLRTEITRFNTEYEQYSDLINTSKQDMEKLKITPRYMSEILYKYAVSKDDIIDDDYVKKIKKKDLLATKICILRKVSRLGDKEGKSEIGTIEILGNKISLEKKYINSIVFCEIDIKNNLLKIGQEVEGKLNGIYKKKFIVKNI